MHVGVLKLKLRLEGNFSLKGKRQLVKPVISQLKSRFDVSAAEVEDQDSWGSAVIGISIVSGDTRVVNQMVSKIIDFVNSGRFDVEVVTTDFEIVNF